MTANGPLMARDARISQRARGVDGTIAPLTRAFAVERVTRIELAWPAWKAGALPLSYTRISVTILRHRQAFGCIHGVGATGLEPAIFCSQSRRASHYATPRPSGAGPNVRDECRARDCADQSSWPDRAVRTVWPG